MTMAFRERPDDVSPSRQVTRAAQWLADQHGAIVRPISTVQSAYGLTIKQACEAAILAAKMRACREAFA